MDPVTEPSLVTDAMLRDAEDKIGQMTLFERGEIWTLQRTVLEAGLKNLLAQREGLLRRCGRPPTVGEGPVTTDQLARLEGQIERQQMLLRFPHDTIARWTDQLRQMREDRQRQA